MSTADTLDIIVSLSTKTVIYIRVFSLFFISPKNRGHFFKRFSFKFFTEIFIFGLDFDSVKILVNTVNKFFHKLVSIFLLPVDEKHAYLG